MRICRLFIIFLLLWTTGLSKAFAYDFSAVCETGQTLYFNIIDDTQHYVELTFPGSYSWSGWNGFDNLVGEMVLPSVVLYNDFEYVVTEIANNAFSNCYSITSVVIPNTIVYIRYEAFKNCVGLNFISLSNSVTSIEYDAFFHCSGFTSISIPNSVTSIGKGAFCGCNGITSISIPNSVTSMGYAVFENCPNLEMIVVETGNPNYDSRDNCNAIIETCSSELVQGCKNTIIPNTISSIGRGAFCGCSGLASIEIPNTVTVISHNAFNGCINLHSIEIPSSVTEIKDAAFAYSGLQSVGIEYGVETLGSYAFYECDDLETVVIPQSVTSIGDQAFADSGLQRVYDLAMTPQAFSTNMFGGASDSYPIYVHTKRVENYKSAWPQYASRIQGVDFSTGTSEGFSGFNNEISW